MDRPGDVSWTSGFSIKKKKILPWLILAERLADKLKTVLFTLSLLNLQFAKRLAN